MTVTICVTRSSSQAQPNENRQRPSNAELQHIRGGGPSPVPNQKKTVYAFCAQHAHHCPKEVLTSELCVPEWRVSRCWTLFDSWQVLRAILRGCWSTRYKHVLQYKFAELSKNTFASLPACETSSVKPPLHTSSGASRPLKKRDTLHA